MGVSVGRGGELAAVRSEEEERLGGDGDGGTLLGPPDNRLNAVGMHLPWTLVCTDEGVWKSGNEALAAV